MDWIKETLSYLKLEYCCGDENDYNDYYTINSEKPTLEYLQEKYKELKINKDTQQKQKESQRLLLESDYIELPSFIQRKGQEVYNKWMSYRSELRLAYHDPELPLPEKPE
jgi:antirestriction protein